MTIGTAIWGLGAIYIYIYVCMYVYVYIYIGLYRDT